MGGALPIDSLRSALGAALREHARVVVRAPTGSGKSTRVPGFLIDDRVVRGQVIVLQPRRLAARMLARRVAAERGSALGAEVGYRVRFDVRAGPDTRLVYETDGILLRQIIQEPDLPGIGAVIFDEFHERHAVSDVLLPLILRLQNTRRPDLKAVVMSATLDSGRLCDYLAPCESLSCEGRTYPVSIEYLERDPRPGAAQVWSLAARETARRLNASGGGNALVFMPGAYEIRRTVDELRRTLSVPGVRVLPLHGELPPAEQDAAVAPDGGRRVIVATNVAETSITVEGVDLVVDGGLARKARFDPARGIDTLWIEKICRASADQRAGRAGRTRPGVCLRLWTEADHAARPAFDPPEIQRVDLAETFLVLKRAGADPLSFPWLDPPLPAAAERALQLLRDLGALAGPADELTPLGERLQSFPLHPRLGRLLVAAAREGCLPAAALAAAAVQERSLFTGPADRLARERRDRVLGDDARSDLVLALRAWRHAAGHGYRVEECAVAGIHAQAARRVETMARQFFDIAAEAGLPAAGTPHAPASAAEEESLRRCLLEAFCDHVARRVGGGGTRYALLRGRRGSLESDSAARGSEFLVAAAIHEIGQAGGASEVRLSDATEIELPWLRELFAGDFREERQVAYEPDLKRVAVRRRVLFRDLCVEESSGGAPSAAETATALAAEIAAGRIALKGWDAAADQWVARVNLLAAHCPESGMAPLDAAARREVIRDLCAGAASVREARERPVLPLLRGRLTPAQAAAVERLAPERLDLPNGRKPKVVYEDGKPPRIALRIQELYGVEKPLTVAGGRVRVQVHVLAPNQRPVQITDDLGSFWRNGYERVKKELRGRYPKHEWR
jgi:ATP-dependent helicase HrpB